MEKKLALIIANGPLNDAAALRARLAEVRPDIVIAADGGAVRAAALGLSPTTIVGDLDSLSPGADADLAERGAAVIRRPPDKDETDLELALLHAAGQGAAEAIVVGAVGGRLDMTVANVQLLLHPDLRGMRIELWTGRQTAWLISPPGDALGGAPGDTLSLVPLTGDVAGVTSHGLAFALNDDTLRLGPARGVSNRIRQVPARLEVRTGALLAVRTPAEPGEQGDPG